MGKITISQLKMALQSVMHRFSSDLSAVKQSVSQVEQSVSQVEQSVSQVEQSVSQVEQSVSQVEQSISQVEQSVSQVEQSISQVEQSVSQVEQSIEYTWDGDTTDKVSFIFNAFPRYKIADVPPYFDWIASATYTYKNTDGTENNLSELLMGENGAWNCGVLVCPNAGTYKIPVTSTVSYAVTVPEPGVYAGMQTTGRYLSKATVVYVTEGHAVVVPALDESMNGKILGVVDGAFALVEPSTLFSNAEEASF